MHTIPVVEIPGSAFRFPDSINGMNQPSLSVILPCHNERMAVVRQVQSIVSQLGKNDELLMLDDGSTDGTSQLLRMFANQRCKYFRNDRPSGVCNAYNFLGSQASKDWILGASGNDFVLPGSIKKWRFAATFLPVARVFFGEILRHSRLAWHTRPVFFPDSSMPALWRWKGGHTTHGAAAFIRRDFWGKGYPPKLEWMADWFQTFILAARHGTGYLPTPISDVVYSPRSYSAAHSNRARFNKAIRSMAEEFALPEYNDVRNRLTDFHKMTGWLNERQ